MPSDRHPFEDRHYTPAEIGKLWNLSTDAVRRLFRNEEGVLLLPSRNSRRALRANYNTMRIPASVMERVYRTFMVGKP
jgi:hypothetical protein